MREQTLVNKQFYLTRAQFEARKAAGTLIVGAEYFITDDNYAKIEDTSTTSLENTWSASKLNTEKVAINARIDNVANIGRFLAVWNCTTGKPTSDPTTLPYTYHTGDYYRIGVVASEGGTNYIPNGSSYTGAASTTTTTERLVAGDIYYYDSTNWVRQVAGAGGTVQDVQINGTSILASGVANIPVAGNARLGVVALGNTLGITIDGTNKLYVTRATDSEIQAKTQQYKPIVPTNLDKAIKEGLGNYNLGTEGANAWSDEYKAHAKEVLGISDTVMSVEIYED